MGSGGDECFSGGSGGKDSCSLKYAGGGRTCRAPPAARVLLGAAPEEASAAGPHAEPDAALDDPGREQPPAAAG